MSKIDEYRYLGHFENSGQAFDAVDMDRGGIATYGPEGKLLGCFYYCPCGCEAGHLNRPKELSGDRPHWNIKVVEGKVTLSPSIRMMSGCKSHYNIEDNKTVWHADTGR